MREFTCPKCGAAYEKHPLDPSAQELCPSCRNKASWEDIRSELANAAKTQISGSVTAAPRRAEPRAGA